LPSSRTRLPSGDAIGLTQVTPQLIRFHAILLLTRASGGATAASQRHFNLLQKAREFAATTGLRADRAVRFAEFGIGQFHAEVPFVCVSRQRRTSPRGRGRPVPTHKTICVSQYRCMPRPTSPILPPPRGRGTLNPLSADTGPMVSDRFRPRLNTRTTCYIVARKRSFARPLTFLAESQQPNRKRDPR